MFAVTLAYEDATALRADDAASKSAARRRPEREAPPGSAARSETTR